MYKSEYEEWLSEYVYDLSGDHNIEKYKHSGLVSLRDLGFRGHPVCPNDTDDNTAKKIIHFEDLISDNEKKKTREGVFSHLLGSLRKRKKDANINILDESQEVLKLGKNTTGPYMIVGYRDGELKGIWTPNPQNNENNGVFDYYYSKDLFALDYHNSLGHYQSRIISELSQQYVQEQVQEITKHGPLTIDKLLNIKVFCDDVIIMIAASLVEACVGLYSKEDLLCKVNEIHKMGYFILGELERGKHPRKADWYFSNICSEHALSILRSHDDYFCFCISEYCREKGYCRIISSDLAEMIAHFANQIDGVAYYPFSGNGEIIDYIDGEIDCEEEDPILFAAALFRSHDELEEGDEWEEYDDGNDIPIKCMIKDGEIWCAVDVTNEDEDYIDEDNYDDEEEYDEDEEYSDEDNYEDDDENDEYLDEDDYEDEGVTEWEINDRYVYLPHKWKKELDHRVKNVDPMLNLADPRKKYDKIILVPPLGTDLNEQQDDLVCKIICQSLLKLNHNGRIVCVMPLTFTEKYGQYLELRKHLCEKYSLQIISIPSIDASLCLVVIDNIGITGYVSFVDTSSLFDCQPEMPQINSITDVIDNNTPGICIEVPIQEVIEQEYSLQPSLYLNK